MSIPTPPPEENNPFAPPASDGVPLTPDAQPTPPPPPPPAPAAPPAPVPPAPVAATPPPPPAAPLPAYATTPAAGYGPSGAALQNGSGTTALVTGILGLLCCGLLSIVAIVTGRKGMRLADQGLANNRTLAQAGFILGIIGVAIWVVGVVFYAIVFIGAMASSSTNVGG